MVSMTKLMEQWVRKAATLPEADQDALAQRLLSEWDDAPLPDWQARLLEERLAEMDANPDEGISLEELKQHLADRRALQ